MTSSEPRRTCYSDGRPAVGLIRSIGPSHNMVIAACEEHWNSRDAEGDRFDKPAVQAPGWLSCLVCGIQLPPYVTPGQASGGTVFDSPGHYGSTAFDPSDRTRLQMVVCDPCLVARSERVLHVTPETRAQPETWTTWSVDDESRAWVTRQAAHRIVPVGHPAVLPDGRTAVFDAAATDEAAMFGDLAVLSVDGSRLDVHVGDEIAPGCIVTWVWTPPQSGSSLVGDPWYAAIAYEITGPVLP